MIRKLVPVLAVLALALTAFAVTASAHKKTFSSDVEAQVVDPRAETLTVSGVVTSPKKACLRGRKVIATTFSKTEIATQTVGTAVTDGTGAFQFDLAKEAERGTIVLVEVLPKRIPPKTKKHKHFCGEGSGAVPVH